MYHLLQSTSNSEPPTSLTLLVKIILSFSSVALQIIFSYLQISSLSLVRKLFLNYHCIHEYTTDFTTPSVYLIHTHSSFTHLGLSLIATSLMPLNHPNIITAEITIPHQPYIFLTGCLCYLSFLSFIQICPFINFYISYKIFTFSLFSGFC